MITKKDARRIHARISAASGKLFEAAGLIAEAGFRQRLEADMEEARGSVAKLIRQWDSLVASEWRGQSEEAK